MYFISILHTINIFLIVEQIYPCKQHIIETELDFLSEIHSNSPDVVAFVVYFVTPNIINSFARASFVRIFANGHDCG